MKIRQRADLAQAPDAATSPADEAVGFLLSHCLNRVSDATDRALASCGLNVRQFGVLHAVYRGMADTPSGIARLRFSNAAAITYTLDLLERRKLLTRKRAPDDRRVTRLQLTVKGEALVAQCIPQVVAAQDAVLRPLADEERALLQTLLIRIAGQAHRGTRSSGSAHD